MPPDVAFSSCGNDRSGLPAGVLGREADRLFWSRRRSALRRVMNSRRQPGPGDTRSCRSGPGGPRRSGCAQPCQLVAAHAASWSRPRTPSGALAPHHWHRSGSPQTHSGTGLRGPDEEPSPVRQQARQVLVPSTSRQQEPVPPWFHANRAARCRLFRLPQRRADVAAGNCRR